MREKGKAKTYFQKVCLLDSLGAIDRDAAETHEGGRTEFVMSNETVSQNARAKTGQDLESWLEPGSRAAGGNQKRLSILGLHCPFKSPILSVLQTMGQKAFTSYNSVSRS